MKNTIYLSIIIILFFLVQISGLVASDNIKQDFVKSLKSMYNIEAFCIDIQIEIYNESSSLNPDKILRASVIRDRRRVFSKYLHLAMISTSKCMLMLDHERKKIYYNVADSLQNERVLIEEDLNKFLTNPSGSINLLHQNGKKHYNIFNPESEISHAEVIIDAETNKLDQITYYYREGSSYGKGRVNINYVWSPFLESYKDFLDENTYIKVEGNTITLQPNYQQYKLVRQDEGVHLPVTW